MKSLSIKKRIVIWYAVSLLLIVVVLFSFLYITSQKAVHDNIKKDLEFYVDHTITDVKLNDDKLTIENNIVYYIDSIYISIIDGSGKTLSGLVVEGFPSDISYKADELRKVSYQGSSFYVYDRLIENQSYGKVWIRGTAPGEVSKLSPEIAFILKLLLIALPIMIVVSILGGYFIARKAFQPIQSIITTTQQIQKGNDLSKRINVDNPNDEIGQTAETFNSMINRLENVFEHERQFVDDASHELRTPVSIIMLESEYAIENTYNPIEIKESLETILDQSKKMQDLIAQLLMLARADKNSYPLSKKTFSISSTLSNILSALEYPASKKNIIIEADVDKGLSFYGDQLLFERMLENLISNSISYSNLDGNIYISVVIKEDTMILEIKDDGIGISSDHIDRIWDRFYRVDSSRSFDDTENNMGLGLPMIKWIVEAHQGSIKVDSALGHGTTFTIYLPMNKF